MFKNGLRLLYTCTLSKRYADAYHVREMLDVGYSSTLTQCQCIAKSKDG